MKTSRIDLVGQNGNDGLHYKYEEVADKIYHMISLMYGDDPSEIIVSKITKILVENFPDE